MSTLKRVQIFAEDMNEEMRDKAVELAQDAMYTTYAEGKVFPQVSEAVRSGMDKEYGQGWNCVVGGAFGAFVTHRTKTYMYFSVFQGVSILLWRA